MTLDFLLLFSMTVFIASIIPGPSMLLAISHGMQFGTRRSLASAMGNVTITLIQALISIVGLGTVLLASETVFLAVKWVGAGYLVHMGIAMLRSSSDTVSPGKTREELGNTSLKRMYIQAALVTAGNPKAIVFFTAVFPQFISPGAPYLFQCAILTGITGLIAFACFMIYALGGEKMVFLFSSACLGKAIKRIIGTSFIGAGIGLAAARG